MNIQTIKQRYGIVGNCREINQAVEVALTVAATDVNVLIHGENGTGKDSFTRIIHQGSRRKHQPFMAINTGAIPEGTLDSELFGHEKGAFTSAIDSRKGYFEEVDGGTIFLDEIAEMPMATQARLLRLLESGEYLRVGSSKVRKTNVRVIAATNKNLMDMIRQNKFREDLFFRLNTVSIFVPPLRDRGEDIELLFRFFALEFAEKYHREPIELDAEAIPILYQYRWPGNVRELKNLVEKLTVLVKENLVTPTILEHNLVVPKSIAPSVISIDHGRNDNGHDLDPEDRDRLLKLIYDLGREVADLKRMIYIGMKGRPDEDEKPYDVGDPYTNYAPEIIPPPNPRGSSTPLIEESLSLEKKEKELITKALRKYNNNRKKAAADLGISERTLYRKIKNFEIEL